MLIQKIMLLVFIAIMASGLFVLCADFIQNLDLYLTDHNDNDKK